MFFSKNKTVNVFKRSSVKDDAVSCDKEHAFRVIGEFEKMVYILLEVDSRTMLCCVTNKVQVGTTLKMICVRHGQNTRAMYM